jgi:hypothetical protein
MGYRHRYLQLSLLIYNLRVRGVEPHNSRPPHLEYMPLLRHVQAQVDIHHLILPDQGEAQLLWPITTRRHRKQQTQPYPQH